MDKLVKAIKIIRLKNEALGQYLTASDDQVSVIVTRPNSQNYNPKNTEWRLEWLKGPKNLDGQVRLFSIYNKALTFTAKDDPGKYWSSSTTTVLTQLPWPPPSSDVGKAAASEWRFVIRNRENGVLVGDLLKWSETRGLNFALSAVPANLFNTRTHLIFTIYSGKGFNEWLNLNSWIIEVVVKGDDNVVLTPSIVSQKISTSPNKAANSLDTNLSTSLKQKTVITPLDEQPMVHSNNVCKSSDVGLFGDHFMGNVLSRCQVGQIIFNVTTPTSSAGFHTSNGQYTNSGGNVNGSGVQKNGDVSLHSEINRSRDNNVKLVNYGYD